MKIYEKKFIRILLVFVMIFSMVITANAGTFSEDRGIMLLGNLKDEFVNVGDSSYTSELFKISNNKNGGNTIRLLFENENDQGVTVELYQYNGLFHDNMQVCEPFHIDKYCNDYFEYSSSNIYGKKFRTVIKSDSGPRITGHLHISRCKKLSGILLILSRLNGKIVETFVSHM